MLTLGAKVLLNHFSIIGNALGTIFPDEIQWAIDQ